MRADMLRMIALTLLVSLGSQLGAAEPLDGATENAAAAPPTTAPQVPSTVPQTTTAVPAEAANAFAGFSETQRKNMLTANIAFGRDEADGFWPLYRDYRRDVAKLQERR